MRVAADGTQLVTVQLTFEVPQDVYMSAGLAPGVPLIYPPPHDVMSGRPPGKVGGHQSVVPEGGSTAEKQREKRVKEEEHCAPTQVSETLIGVTFDYVSLPNLSPDEIAVYVQKTAVATFVQSVWQQIFAAGYPPP